MQEERLGSGPLWFNDPRREAMLEPDVLPRYSTGRSPR